jgi:hypothetical protein
MSHNFFVLILILKLNACSISPLNPPEGDLNYIAHEKTAPLWGAGGLSKELLLN